jgi:hypothetical protein
MHLLQRINGLPDNKDQFLKIESLHYLRHPTPQIRQFSTQHLLVRCSAMFERQESAA